MMNCSVSGAGAFPSLATGLGLTTAGAPDVLTSPAIAASFAMTTAAAAAAVPAPGLPLSVPGAGAVTGLTNGVGVGVSPPGPNGLMPKTYTFCHDYLNSVCKRKVCKYIHCTKEEEDLYRRTGHLPDRLKFLAEHGLSALANMHSSPQEVPLCRDFQRGFCERGDQCKFTHLQDKPNPSTTPCDNGSAGNGGGGGGGKQLKRSSNESASSPPPSDAASTTTENTINGTGNGPVRNETTNSPKLAKLDLDSQADANGSKSEMTLLEENEKLREKIEQFSKQIEELSARNQALIAQNSKLKSAAELLKASSNYSLSPSYNQVALSNSNGLNGLQSCYGSLNGKGAGAGALYFPSSAHSAANGLTSQLCVQQQLAQQQAQAQAQAQAVAAASNPNKLIYHQMAAAYNAAAIFSSAAVLNPAATGAPGTLSQTGANAGAPQGYTPVLVAAPGGLARPAQLTHNPALYAAVGDEVSEKEYVYQN